MANTLGTTSTGLLAARAIQIAVTSPLLSAFAFDYEQYAPNLPSAGKGETIKAKIPSVPSVSDFGSAAADTGTTEVTITLDQWKQVQHDITAAELVAVSQASAGSTEAALLLNARAQLMAGSLMRNIASTILGKVTTANGYTALTAAAAGDMDFDYLVDASGTLDAATRYTPDAGRFVVVNTDMFATLLKDPRVNQQYKATLANDPIKTGVIEDVAGFRVIKCPFLNTANTHTKLTCIFGSGDAVGWGSRHPADPTGLFAGAPTDSVNEAMVDPATGVRFLNQEWVSTKALTAGMRVSVLYGAGIGNVQHALLGVAV